MLALKESPTTRPRLVLAHADPLYAALVRQIFLRLRWNVHITASGVQAREMVGELSPAMVILDAELPDESGWLTCAKLLRAEPRLRVIVVGGPTSDGPQLARFLGVEAPMPSDVSAEKLVERIENAITG